MTNNKITLRDFEASDLPALREMILETIDISYNGVYAPSAIQHFKKHHSEEEILKEASEGYIILLECDGKLVGTGTLIGNKITRMYVLHSYQGKGFGKRIINALELHARARGDKSVFLYSSIVAKPFYESGGYILNEENAAKMEDGESLKYFKMTKYLS